MYKINIFKESFSVSGRRKNKKLPWQPLKNLQNSRAIPVLCCLQFLSANAYNLDKIH
jgi:hypothetical protein